MTENEEQLLLKYLCMALPYGVICQHTTYGLPITVTHKLGLGGIDNFMHDFGEIKPYLRSMSSMTEEEKVFYDSMFIEIDGSYYAMFPSETIDWLNAHHFDYRGLIEKGLALEAPEGMYIKK